MNFCKRHIIFIIATLVLLIVGCYEAYWLHGVYATGRESVLSIIRSAVGRAEIQEYAARFRNERRSDSLIVVNARSGDVSTKIMSMAMDTLSGKPRQITVHRLDDPQLTSKLPTLHALDIGQIDDLLRAQLDSAGLSIEHRLTFVGYGNEADSVSASTRGFLPSSDDKTLFVTSYLNNGHYEFRSGSLTGYVLSNLSGTIVLSAGTLLVVAAAFAFMGRAMRKQRELDELKNDFTRNMTHELKTPIAVAYAAGDMLLECGLDNDPVKREEYLYIIQEQLSNLSGMVEQILTTTVENRDSLRLECAVTDIGSLMEEAASRTKLKTHKPCDISLSVEPESVEILMDRKLMLSVLLTLLDNAVKYSGARVEIHLKACQIEERVTISISDNGIGIGARELPHIFDKYYRVPTGDRHDVKGYGIGLFFAKDIVEKHGGRITADSTPGKGSTFIIELPC